MRPGRIVFPVTSSTSVPAGQGPAPVVTASMRPSRRTIVVSRTGAAPVPSISVAPRSTLMESPSAGKYSPVQSACGIDSWSAKLAGGQRVEGLQRGEPSVDAVLAGHQLLVGADLRDAPAVDDDHAVRVLHRRE